ncbi:YebC/PmpR family DNA-binding transcriptional regulator [Candidatus Peregrinibacteria bacterium CG_4_10_14_0_2_um_filter_43_11]|nr:MAG: YebC/PmpR family DNA-binding transcriptional regulator [Candidatus Peregrinibacteria bacterium CG_4_10_14_0_2_um_filter_43_11]
MSGHSKWHSIKHKKGAADAKRGKIFTRHANLITMATRDGGGDPNMNPTLRLTIENAKRENVPNANIERAIKRGSGELKDAEEIHEVIYEGYGQAGVAIMVVCLTDNKNRTLTNIRTVFNKKGGGLGTSGSVAYLFERRGVITLSINETSQKDDAELAAIDAGASDIFSEGNNIEIYTEPNQLTAINEKLEKAGYKADKAEVLFVPKNTIKIEDEITAKKILELMDAIEEDPDVSDVSGNFDISEELMQRIE